MSRTARRLLGLVGLLVAGVLNSPAVLAQLPSHPSVAVEQAENARIPVLAYHNVLLTKDEDELRESVTVDDLSRQFAWLAAKGYTPITVEQLRQAATEPTVLPRKPVLLTFDDGFESTHTHVLPLLRAYQWPALVAIVGSWVEAREQSETPVVKGQPRYMNKQEIRELSESGLIEFASHTYDLHHGVPANAWGNQQPAAVTRVWTDEGIESDAQWDARVRADIARNQAYLQKLTGKAPQALVWPYGRFNDALKAVAKDTGIAVLFTLDDDITDVTQGLDSVRRHLVTRDEQEGDLASLMEATDTSLSPMRAIRLRVADLAESLPGANAGSAPSSMSSALNKLLEAGGNTLILDAFSRVNGKIVASFFHNSVLPVTRDYANRVSALSSGKAGYRTWLTVSLDSDDYVGLTKDQVLQVVEDTAKAIPLAGLLIENAQRADAATVLAIKSRVAKWRASPVIALDWNGPYAPRMEQLRLETGAQYVIAAQAVLPEAVLDRSWLVVDVNAGSLPNLRSAARAGYVNFSLSSIPPVTLDWLTAFSLRGKPLQRVALPTEVSAGKGAHKE
jgi:peptidoglycan/xylan/chitin deacetylase (PgdA/CDA1 family)